MMAAAVVGPVMEAAAGVAHRALLSVNGPAPPGLAGPSSGFKAQLFCDTQNPTYEHPVDDVS